MGFLGGLAYLQTALAGEKPAPIVVAQARGLKKPPIGIQPPGSEPLKDGEKHDSVSLPTNPDAKNLLGVAKDFISEEDWGRAAAILQALFDEFPEDSFLEVKQKV